MSKSKHSEAQMIEALNHVEAGRSVEEVGQRLRGVQAHESTPGSRSTAAWT